nr:glycosyltransferase [Lachnospiraceae bacterium]
MYSDNSNLSGVHKFLRESKALYPARLTYAQINDTVRFGPKYESEKVKTSIRRKINNRNYRKKLIISEDEVSRQQEREFHEPKLISIIVPLYNTKKEFLIEMIESVINQTYDNYQLCLADGSDEDNSHVEKIVKSYIKNNTKIKYKKLKENGGISVNTNECIKLATGDYILLFDHDDVLHESLLYELMDRIEETKADFIYTDEAIFTNDITKPFGYHFKPDYSLHALRSNNYICHASCFSRELFEKAGDFRKEFDGSQDHDLI